MTLLSAQVSAIADAMGRNDPRRRVLREAVTRLKAWEMRAGLVEREPPPPPELGTTEAQCGLCGHEGVRYSTNCPECGERW